MKTCNMLLLPRSVDMDVLDILKVSIIAHHVVPKQIQLSAICLLTDTLTLPSRRRLCC